MKHEPKIIVLPDIHGRKFWMDVMDNNCDIVFLGDYLDPYQHEGITKVDAIGGADIFFPNLDTNPNFTCVETSEPILDNGYTIRFTTYKNVNKIPL